MASRSFRLAMWAVLGCATIMACPSPYADEGAPDAGSDAAAEGGGDANADDGGDATAADAAACDPAKPFGTPVIIAELSSAGQDYTLAFTADERTVILASSRVDAGQRLYVASRAKTDDPFPTPVELTMAGADMATAPSLTADGGLLFFVMPTADAGYDLFSTTRLATPAIAYDVPQPVNELNTAANELTPALSADGDEVFFVSSQAGQQAIYRSTRTASRKFRAPATLVSEVFIDGGRQISPVLSSDGKTLYFAAETPSGLGVLDVWVASRPTRLDPFGAPRPVPEVSSTASDQPVWISPDGCRLYVASGRSGGNRGFDFFVATKPR